MRRPIRVLMLEDDERDGELNREALESAHLNVECRRVSSRTEFEEALRTFAPDVALLDYNLPGFDGRTALAILRSQYRDVAAIIMSGTLRDDVAVEMLKAGAADYVLKDRPARLASAVTKALDDEYRRRERVVAQRELESKVVLLATEQESSPDGILVVDGSGKVISQNHQFLEMWGVPEDLWGNIEDSKLLRFVTNQLAEPEAFLARVAYLYAHQEEKSHEEIQTTDGRTIDRHSSPMFDSRGVYLGRVWFFRDVTAERKGEQSLRLFRNLVDNSNDALFVVDPETLNILDANERACIDLKYPREELLCKRVPDIDVGVEEARIRKAKNHLCNGGKIVVETQLRRADGSQYPVEVSSNLVTLDRQYYLSVIRNITERRRSQEALKESEVRFRTLIEDASDPVAIVERDGTVRYTSPAKTEVSGFDPSEIHGRKVAEFVHPEDADRVVRQLGVVLDNPEMIVRFITRLRRRDGTWRTVDCILRNRLESPPIFGLVMTFRDVTERERLVRALSAMTAANAAIVRASDESSLAEEICRIMVEIGGYRMAWIGSPERDERKSIRVMGQAGEDDDYLKVADISWEDTPHGHGPTGTAIRTAHTQISSEYARNAATVEQQAKASERGFEACVAIPLAGHDGVFGVITLYANDPAAFDDDEVKLLEQLSADVSYGIQAMRERKNHAFDLERLERNLESTIEAIAAMVETRDPYTAGHERRVAVLSGAIAGELGLSPEKVRALQLAASIHDVGKIQIPTEILVKPGGLSAVEYTLVQSHAQAGYEILKNIDFPWPIAQMVYQHHEKLDGSGYPRGLHGEETLLESRILAVADVVEAMSSHRPYRPSLGIDAALDEIRNKRGIQFDAAAVDACIRLFKEKGFELR